MSSDRQWAAPAPYRLLFPIGMAFATAGTLPWLLYAAGRASWPGPLHAALMIEGFELCFVLGFLLSSIPAFTHGAHTTLPELAGAVAGPVAFGTCLELGHPTAAMAVFTLTLAGLALAVSSRGVIVRRLPAEEFLFVLLGLVLGMAGGVIQSGASLQWWEEPTPRFGLHLVSVGMMLALVLGVGSLMVPVFVGIRDPLAIPGVAGPHDRHGRRPLYVTLALALTSSFVAEGAGLARVGELLRALVATVFVALVWKLVQRPGRQALGAWTMWSAGWLVVIGLWLATAFPLQAVTYHHLVFIGGYGLLTLAIGTRVVVGHGRHPVTDEGRVLSPLVVTGVALALVLRVTSDWLPPRAQPTALAASAALWIGSWLTWGFRAMRRIVSVRINPAPAPLAPKTPATVTPPRAGRARLHE